MKKFFSTLNRLNKPLALPNWYSNALVAIPRILAGLMLCLEFGSSKFGMPWSTTEEMGLFQVADGFPEGVAEFGFPFSLSPHLFAWLAAAT